MFLSYIPQRLKEGNHTWEVGSPPLNFRSAHKYSHNLIEQLVYVCIINFIILSVHRCHNLKCLCLSNNSEENETIPK